MSGPSFISYIRHYLGRALRETGQALDRVGARGVTHASSQRKVGDDAYVFHNIISRHRPRMELLKRGAPRVHKNTFIAPCSTLIGSVAIGKNSSVWYGAVLRADRCLNGLSASDTREVSSDADYFKEAEDLNFDDISGFGGGVINVGCDTNLQDGVIVTAKVGHSKIGNGVTIGHSAQIHSATIGNDSLIGMGSMVLPGARVESNAFVAAGAVVESGVVVPSGELWAGRPAKKLRELTDAQLEKIKYQASEYVKLSASHLHVMDLGGNVHDVQKLEIGDDDLSTNTSDINNESVDGDSFQERNEVKEENKRTISI